MKSIYSAVHSVKKLKCSS